jgi:DNA repair protein RadC
MPSEADIAMTREMVEAGARMGINVHDHLVIGKGRHENFKALG